MADTLSPSTGPLSHFPLAHNFGRSPDPSLPRARGGETWEDFFAAELGVDGDRTEVLSTGAAADVGLGVGVGGAELDRVDSVADSTASSGSFWARRLQTRTHLVFPSRRPSLPNLHLPSRPHTSGGGATPRRLAKRPKTAPSARPLSHLSPSLDSGSALPIPQAPLAVRSPAPSSPASSVGASGGGAAAPVGHVSLAQRVLYVLSFGMAGRGRKRAREGEW